MLHYDQKNHTRNAKSKRAKRFLETMEQFFVKNNKVVEFFSQNKKKKEQSKESTCFFYKKVGHMNKEYFKYATWHEKKSNFYTSVCFEINLVYVPNDTWWVDSDATTHTSMSMHDFLWSHLSNDAVRFIYVGDGNKLQYKL